MTSLLTPTYSLRLGTQIWQKELLRGEVEL